MGARIGIYYNDVYPMSTKTACLTGSVLYFLLKCNLANNIPIFRNHVHFLLHFITLLK